MLSLASAAHLVTLVQTDQGTHVDVSTRGVAHSDRGQLGAHRIRNLVQTVLRHQGAADGGALLARFDRHLGDQLFDEEIEFGCFRHRVRTEDGAVQRVRLGIEADGVAGNHRMGAQRHRGVGGSGDREQILTGQVVEEITGRGTDELKGAGWQQARLDGSAHHEFSEVGGLTGGLDDAGHPGEKGGGELLEHAPHREVERVDLHRRTDQRRVNMLHTDGSALADRLGDAIEQRTRCRQFPGALSAVDEQHTHSAVDVNL